MPFRFDKDANRYLGDFNYRFNRRFNLDAMTERVVHAICSCTARPRAPPEERGVCYLIKRRVACSISQSRKTTRRASYGGFGSIERPLLWDGYHLAPSNASEAVVTVFEVLIDHLLSPSLGVKIDDALADFQWSR